MKSREVEEEFSDELNSEEKEGQFSNVEEELDNDEISEKSDKKRVVGKKGF